MKSKILDIYNGTKTLYIFNDEIYTIRGDKGDLYRGSQQIDTNVEMYLIGPYKEGVCYVKEDNKTIIDGSLIDKSILPKSIFNNKAVFTSDFDLQTRTKRNEIISLETKEIIHDLGPLSFRSKTISDEGFFIHITDESILVYNYYENKVIEKSCIELLKDERCKITNLISIYEGKLYAGTSDRQIVVISLYDLTLLKSWNKIPSLIIGSMYNEVIPDTSIFTMDQKQRKLIGLFHKHLIEVPIDSNDIKFKDMTLSLSENNINSLRPTYPLPITNDYIFTIGHFDVAEKPDVDFKGVIVFDRNKNLVIDTYIFLDRDIGTRNPILGNECVYLVDWGNNVHELKIE